MHIFDACPFLDFDLTSNLSMYFVRQLALTVGSKIGGKRPNRPLFLFGAASWI